MPYGSRTMLITAGNRPRWRFVRSLFATFIGAIEPHSHIRWSAIKRGLDSLQLPLHPAHVLEVGCGGGEMTLELAAMLKPDLFMACDLANPSLSRAVASCAIADATHLPFASNSQDLVTILDVIEHIELDNDVLREVIRVLQPGGHVLISVPTPEYPRWFGRSFHESLGHVRDGYTPDQLVAMVERVGLEPLLVRSYTGVLFLAFAAFYYRYLRSNVFASALAVAVSKPLVLADRYLPSPTWGSLVLTALKPPK